MKKVENLLKENFIIISQKDFLFSLAEINFLNEFFNIYEDEFYDSKQEKFRKFFILEKKEKFLPFSCNF